MKLIRRGKEQVIIYMKLIRRGEHIMHIFIKLIRRGKEQVIHIHEAN